MHKQFINYIFKVCLLISVMIATPANAETTIALLFDKIQNKEWQKARVIAKELDAQKEQGDVFLAFADSMEAANRGDCTTAKQLASIVIQSTPGFLPAYDVLAGCLVSEGKYNEASQLYQDLSNQLRDGPEKEIAQNKANSLKPNLSPTVAVDFSITPSSNTSRRTSNTTTGNGGILTKASRAQRGITALGSIKLSKPIFKSKRLLSQVSLKIGGQYNTVTKTLLPSIGTELRNTWFLSNNKSIYAAPFYEYTWQSGERFYDETGLRFGSSVAFDERNLFSSNFVISKRNFLNKGADSTLLYAALDYTVLINQNNKLKLYGTFTDINADDIFFNLTEYSIGAELEHHFESGLITSIASTIGTRQYDRSAALTFESQEDTYYSTSIGFSHQKFTIGEIRPEIVYTYTNQRSNDLFYDFSAHDIGLKLKANY